MTKHQDLIHSLYQIGAVQFGEFQLKSGQTSSIYINLRKIISYPDVLRAVADAMWDIARHLSFDLICGVPYTALPIATCLSLSHNIPMIIRRKEKKDYGTKQMIEGEFKSGERTLIIEDIVTSGSSIIETANELHQAELTITDLIALIDREQGGRETLSQKYRLHTVFSLSEILHTLHSSTHVKHEEQIIIQHFLSEHRKVS